MCCCLSGTNTHNFIDNWCNVSGSFFCIMCQNIWPKLEPNVGIPIGQSIGTPIGQSIGTPIDQSIGKHIGILDRIKNVFIH
jgi:hypothetical protein